MESSDAIRTKQLTHLTQAEVARRWRMSQRTLERWRWQKIGPDYLKAGGRVLYRLEDIEAYEAAQHRHVATKKRSDS